MKCQNCGKEEVNFHYTSNINGTVTEKHLCAECANKLGLMNESVFRPEMSFEQIFAEMFGMRQPKSMFGGYGMMLPAFVIPPVGFVLPQQGYGSEQSYEPGTAAQTEAAAPSGVTPEVDEDMKKRREMNILREQMRCAVEAEDFEQAAELRDKIRKIES